MQYGPDPIKDSVQIPMNEADMKGTKWGSGKCFYTMGKFAKFFPGSEKLQISEFRTTLLVQRDQRHELRLLHP